MEKNDAAEQFYHTYRSLIFRTAKRLCRTKEEQEELIQDSLLRFLKNLAYYTERNSDETAALIVLTISLQQKTFLFDTEEANSVKRMKIGKYDAILVEKNGYRLAWFDAENNVLYQLVSDALSQEEIVNIANNLLCL